MESETENVEVPKYQLAESQCSRCRVKDVLVPGEKYKVCIRCRTYSRERARIKRKELSDLRKAQLAEGIIEKKKPGRKPKVIPEGVPDVVPEEKSENPPKVPKPRPVRDIVEVVEVNSEFFRKRDVDGQKVPTRIINAAQKLIKSCVEGCNVTIIVEHTDFYYERNITDTPKPKVIRKLSSAVPKRVIKGIVIPQPELDQPEPEEELDHTGEKEEGNELEYVRESELDQNIFRTSS
jgi:hypothetical protein